MSDAIPAGEAIEAQPISAKERIITLDVLRGFALFGIMFVNVYAFVNPASWFTVPWQELGAAEYGVEVFKLLFTQGKFYTLFAFLFGLGFAVQLASAERRGGKFAGRFFWRLLLLWLIGVFHVIFIWDGDILNSYAIGGSLLLLCYGLKRLLDKGFKRFSKKRDKLPRGAMLVVAAILLFGPLTIFGVGVAYSQKVEQSVAAGETLSEREQTMFDQIQKRRSPEAKAKREARADKLNEVYTNGSYADTFATRLDGASRRLMSGPFWLTICGIFLIGAYFGRNNFIGRASELRSGFVKLGIYSFIVSIPFNLLFVYAQIAKPSEGGMFWMWLTYFNKTTSGLAMALTFVSVITLAMLGPLNRWLKHLAPVGQMALTNYLTQSIVGSIVFYGFGFGLIGKLNAFTQIGYMIVLFGCQMVFSRWWLERYRFGPMEWLWRSLTYMKMQPMRVERSL